MAQCPQCNRETSNDRVLGEWCRCGFHRPTRKRLRINEKSEVLDRNLEDAERDEYLDAWELMLAEDE